MLPEHRAFHCYDSDYYSNRLGDALLVGVEGFAKVFSFEMEVTDPIQQHGNFGMVVTQSAPSNLQTFLVQL